MFKIKKGSGIYNRLEERAFIEPTVLRKACDEIRAKYPQKNLPDYIIGALIGGHRNTISNAKDGSSIPQNVFEKLEKMLGKPIQHKTSTSIGDLIELEENEETAEFISIMLGDGNINEKNRTIVITLNGVDEFPYVQYVKALMKQILKKAPTERWSRDNNDPTRNKGVKLRIYSLTIVEALKEAGLVPGNKVKNQVSIPQKFKRFTKASLKGLVDTDGTIYIQKKDKSFVISFVNGSKKLVENFRNLCLKLKIPTTKLNQYLRKADNKYVYSVSIGSKEGVKQFLEKIHPEKWKDKNRREFWGIQLTYLNAPEEIRNSIIERIINDYPNPTKRKFSIEFLKYLRKLIKKYDLDVSPQQIENAISRAFIFMRNKYSIEIAKTLKNLFVETGSLRLVIENFDGNPIDQKTTKQYIHKLFSEQNYSFEKWYKYNQNLFLDENGNLRRIDKKLRKSICRRIFTILKNFNIKYNETFEKLKEIIDTEVLDGDNHKRSILKFERLSFLLNHPKYGENIKVILKGHINFVKTILIHNKLKETVFKVDLFEEFRLLGSKKTMMELILDLEQKFNVKFDIFYKKGLKR